MLHFRLFRIPVYVHFSHFVVALIFPAMAFNSGQGWPFEILTKKDHPDWMATWAMYIAIWVGVVFFSTLFHELGHALVSRAFGYQPTVQLVALGGVTQYAERPVPWHREVAITLAGPLFGLTLAGLAFGGTLLASRVRVPEGPLPHALGLLFVANLVWSLYNLLPLGRLDGGGIARALLMRLFGRPGFLLAHLLALGVAIAVGLYALNARAVWLTFFMALYLVDAVRGISDYFRGAAPGGEQPAPSPEPSPHDEAQRLFTEGRLDDAERVARRLAALDLEPRVRAAIHHLLGWIALKRGEGRAALDHFSQVHGQTVEPEAVAAAFSLVGDDARALPLWLQATEASPQNAVLRHEYAGALIRAGQREAAMALSGVDPVTAHACAERLLFQRGDYQRAGEVGEASLRISPQARIAYEAACAYARAGNPEASLRMLEEASRMGFVDASRARHDEDLAALQRVPAFVEWLRRVEQSAHG
jgi:Zn-dependent protease